MKVLMIKMLSMIFLILWKTGSKIMESKLHKNNIKKITFKLWQLKRRITHSYNANNGISRCCILHDNSLKINKLRRFSLSLFPHKIRRVLEMRTNF